MRKFVLLLIFVLLAFNVGGENESAAETQNKPQSQTNIRNDKNTFYFVGVAKLAEQEIAAKIVVPIFKKAGYNVVVELYPGIRAKEYSISGERDGEISRTYSFGEKNPSLIRVPTAYSSVEITAFALKKLGIVINSTDDLPKYRIAKLRGVQAAIDLTVDCPNVIDVDSVDELMRVLLLGMADIAITSDIGGISKINKLHKSDEIAVLKVISSLPKYIYFNKKHKEVVPKIDRVVKEMVRSGEMKRLRRQYEAEY